MTETHRVVWESHSGKIREDLLEERTCNCDLRVAVGLNQRKTEQAKALMLDRT